MKIHFGRSVLSCLVCIFLNWVSMPTVVSQESKPDEVAKDNTPRAGKNGIGMPVCVYCPPPKYSKKARADKLQGSVLLNVIVTVEGKATNITLVKGLGEGLDEKAIEAVKSWKFKPATDSAGNRVAAVVPIQVSFRFRD